MLPEILALPIEESDRMLRVLYESLYSEYDFMPDWHTVQYQAPETQAGYCVRTLRHALNKLQLEFLITPIS
jgi:hypothetical protein